MNTENVSRLNSIVFLNWGDPMIFKNTTDNEARIKNRDSKDPEQGPKPERGDNNLFIGAVIGVIIGCIAGGYIGNSLTGISGVFAGLIIGAIIGGLGGIYTGSYLKNRKVKKYEEKFRA
jgi:uncharacterized protein YcfJ